MIRKILYLLLGSLLFVSCVSKNINRMQERANVVANEYGIHRLETKRYDGCISEYFYFSRGREVVGGIALELISFTDGGASLSMVPDYVNQWHLGKIKTYEEQMKLLDMFLKKSSYRKIKSLRNISMSLLFAGDIDGELTKKYNDLNGRQSIEPIIYDSRMRTMLDSVLQTYHLCVKDVFVEKYGLVDKSVLKEHAIPLRNYDAMPQKVLQGYVYFNLSMFDVEVKAKEY